MNTRTKRVPLVALMTIVVLAACVFGLTHGMTQAHAETSTEYPGLEFVLINNGDEYSVRAADKQITGAAIPATYKGLPVTEIAANGFSSCTQLEKVIIPPSVTKIGNNAFMRCTSLTEVSGMGNVTTYGVAAFSMCSNLEYIILPSTVDSLGSGMLRDVNCTLYSRATEDKLSALGTAWKTAFGGDIIYGNVLVFNDYELNGEEGLTLVSYQNIETAGEVLVIPSFVDFDSEGNEVNKKVLNISSFALAGCNIGEIIVKHPDGTNYTHSINLNAYAFSEVLTNNIRIETDITLEDSDYGASEGLFYYSTIQSVTLPNNITEFPKYMFSECRLLSDINNLDQSVATNHISDKVVKIGEEAFKNCYEIDELYIADTIKEIGGNAFSGWGNKPNPDENYKQYIGIDILEEEAEGWTLWDNEINAEYCEADFTAASEFTVNFVAEKEGIHNVTGSASIVIQRGGTLSDADIVVPTSTSHDFSGVWYTTENRTVGTEFDLDKPIKRNYTLYAGWNVKTFEITFEDSEIVKYYKYNGSRDKLSGLSLSYEYGWRLDFVVDIKLGYENTRIYFGDTEIAADENGVYSLYFIKNGQVESKSNKTEYSIEYKNLRGGEKGANNKATYTIEDLPLTLDDPVWTQGYEKGIWEIPPVTENTLRNIEVSALWSGAVEHKITYENLRAGTKGANNKATYTADDLIGKSYLQLDKPIWNAAYNDSAWDMPIINDDNLIDFTAKAVWRNPVEFYITYRFLDGGTKGANNNDKYTADDLDETGRLHLDDPSWPAAYKSGSWSMPVINDHNLGDFTATAVWGEFKEYNITYDVSKDCEFYYCLEELPWRYSEAPLLKINQNKVRFTYFDEIIFTYVPGKTGYIGEWCINGNAIDRIPLHTSSDVTVTCIWKPITYTVDVCYQNLRGFDYDGVYTYSADIAERRSFTATYDVAYAEYAKEIEGYDLYCWYINYYEREFPLQTIDKLQNPLRFSNLRWYQGGYVQIILVYDVVAAEGGCVADGTMITLADGTQKAVNELTGDEMLLAWNLKTGTFDVAPILFIDRDPAQITEVIKLRFSDDTEVKVIYEHGFWDFDLNRYVYIKADAAQYIGHWFNKQILDENGAMTWTKVQLVDVEITEEYTAAWSPVTYGHLCYYVNGMLSMPGGIEGLFNIFEVGEDMKFDAEAMEKDIQTYGLFTYEEFAELVSVPEEMFNAVSGQYLKVAIGKGLITAERLQQLVDIYCVFFK